MPQDAKPPVALIGAGALGAALAGRLAEAGYPIAAVVSRTAAQADAVAARVGARIADTDVEALPPDARLVFCCIPDDGLPLLAHRLAAARPAWDGTVVAHTSGALAASVLHVVGAQGANLLSFHPLQTFTPGTPPAAFAGIYVALEGTDPAVALGERVASDLGAHSFRLAAAAKTRYHLAATMASNYFVTLMALVEEILASAGIDEVDGTTLMRPLVESTWRNLLQHRPADALSGPVARGDRRTVEEHLHALARHRPELLPAYTILGAETVRLAAEGGRLDPRAAQHVLDALYAALDAYQNTEL